MRPRSSLFISFEGIDGAGKTTHITSLAAAFAAHGSSVLRTREPGGTALAEQLRQIVLHERMDALTEALLVFAARRDHVQQVIVPALERGQVVLCDRFADATFAYQGGGRDFDWATLQQIEQMVLAQAAPDGATDGALSPKGAGAQLQPDLTLWFDLSAQIAAQRLADARQPDKFEAEPAAFFERVAAGYARRAQENPQRFCRIDASQPVAAVWQQVLQAMQHKGWLA